MAKTRRVGLALTDEVDLALSKLSSLTGQSKSGIISELLTDALPILQQVIKAIDEAKTGQLQAAVQTTAKYLAETSLQLNQTHLNLGELKGKHGL